jgi:hypothetical protein
MSSAKRSNNPGTSSIRGSTVSGQTVYRHYTNGAYAGHSRAGRSVYGDRTYTNFGRNGQRTGSATYIGGKYRFGR